MYCNPNAMGDAARVKRDTDMERSRPLLKRVQLYRDRNAGIVSPAWREGRKPNPGIQTPQSFALQS